MTLPKRVLSAALCLSLLFMAIPIRAGAAINGLPVTISTTGATYQYAISKQDPDQVKHGTATSAKTAGTITATAESNGIKIEIDTGYNKNFKLCYKEIPVTVRVPANMTYYLQLNFNLKGTHRRQNVKARAMVSYQVVYLGDSPASSGNVVFYPYNEMGGEETKTTLNGSSENTNVLQEELYYTDSKGSTGTVVTYPKTVKYGFVNDTNQAKDITQYFGVWTASNYGSTYKNQSLVTLTVEPELIAYTLNLDPNGGSMSSTYTTVNYGKTYRDIHNYDISKPSRIGYTFSGWYTAKTGGTKVSEESTVFNESIGNTIYAHWTAKNYTVTFDPGDGTVSPTSQSVTYGSTYGTLPTPTLEGYDFDGWYTSETGGVKVVSTATVRTSRNHTLYARYKIGQYTVTFDPDGGSVTQKTKTVSFGGTYGDLPTPTCSGYVFGGWYTGKDGDGTEITSTTAVTITGDQRLYALWLDYPLIHWGDDLTVKFGNTCTPGYHEFSADKGYTYLFELYKCDGPDRSNPKLVGTKTPDTDTVQTSSDLAIGDHYYYLIITHTQLKTGKSVINTGPVVKVTVIPSTPVVYNGTDFPKVSMDLKQSNRVGDYELIGGSMMNAYTNVLVPGTFSWEDADTELTWTGDNQRVHVIFTPDDLTSYTTAVISVTVSITCSHNFVDYKVITAATCTTSGSMRMKCDICGDLIKRTIPATGHDYENGTWKTSDTQHWKQCAACSSTNTPEDHIFGEWSGGKRACEVCGYEETQVITVTITWNEMMFTYTAGSWDPETHNYASGEWTVDTEDGNMITVVNDGEADITVTFVYTQSDVCVDGRFTDDGGSAINSPVALSANDRKSIRLLLSGKPEQELIAANVGTVTIYLGSQ